MDADILIKNNSVARILIEMDVTQPLPTEVQIEDATGVIYPQKGVYEWKPPFCVACNKVGHNCAKTKASKASKPKFKNGCQKLQLRLLILSLFLSHLNLSLL